MELVNKSVQHGICFLGERGLFICGEHFWGGVYKVTHTSLYKHSYALTKHCWSRLKWPPKKPKKYAQKIWNSLLAPKIRHQTFSKWFYVSGNVLFCKFYQLNVYWKRVEEYKDHLGSEAQRNTPCCICSLMLLNGQEEPAVSTQSPWDTYLPKAGRCLETKRQFLLWETLSVLLRDQMFLKLKSFWHNAALTLPQSAWRPTAAHIN